MGADLAHCGCTEADLAVPFGRCPATVEKRSRPRMAVPAIAPTAHLVDGDLGGKTAGNRCDGVVVLGGS